MIFSYCKLIGTNFSDYNMLKDENLRFIELVEELKINGKIADYVQLASSLGTNKAGISDIKSGRKKISIELMRRMKLSYPEVNIEWVIMGVGDKFCTQSSQIDIQKSPTQNVDISELFKQFAPILEQKGILVMNQGNVLEQGTHDSLMAQKGFYANLYQSQFADSETA